MINAVFFDIGGTILDESREFETWADWLGVPQLPRLVAEHTAAGARRADG